MSLELSGVVVFPSGKSTNIGYGTATFNEGLQVRFNIRKSKAGQAFVSWPQSQYTDKEGKTAYSNEVTLLKEVSDDINNQIIAEFNKALAIGATPAPKPSTPENNSTVASVVIDTKAKKPKI